MASKIWYIHSLLQTKTCAISDAQRFVWYACCWVFVIVDLSVADRRSTGGDVWILSHPLFHSKSQTVHCWEHLHLLWMARGRAVLHSSCLTNQQKTSIEEGATSGSKKINNNCALSCSFNVTTSGILWPHAKLKKGYVAFFAKLKTSRFRDTLPCTAAVKIYLALWCIVAN